MILLNIDPKRKEPLFKQIFNQLKKMIEEEVLIPGDRLPSTRILAKQNGLNRTTVYKAYEELWAQGYIESKSGSYSTVRERKRAISPNDPRISPNFKWENKISLNVKQLVEPDESIKNQLLKDEIINFTPLSPDPAIIPNEEFRKCINETLKENNLSLLLYGDSFGYKPLREFLAHHMLLHSINCSVSDVVITNGAQNAIELILKLLVEPNSEVIIEKPTYSAIIPLLNYYRAKILEVPVNEEGMDLEALEQILKKHQPKMVYTMPNFQNPTGITTSQAHRERLLELCENYEVPIIEDGFVEEMKYFGKNILPIKSMDKSGLVFYVGTFSKVLFPGLRLGWIVSNSFCTERFAEIKKASEISGNTIDQAALELFCSKGLYEIQLKRIHKVYRKRMNIALKTLREHIQNPNVHYTKPIGGYTIWFEVGQSIISEPDLIQLMYDNDISVTPGRLSFYSSSGKTHFRISIAHRNEDEIEQGIKQIASVLNNLDK